MNQKTAKLLKKWARATSKPPREVKRWWMTLDWQTRTAERIKIRREVEKS